MEARGATPCLEVGCVPRGTDAASLSRACYQVAVLTVATAARIERLRILARTQPEAAASYVFSKYELRALTLMKRKYAKRTELISDDVPCMADAVRWPAELGGHAGRKTSGPPGAVTMSRGLDFITPIALALEALESEAEL